ncbi:MAG: hypothetical protein ABIG89_00160 [Candidatus Woesearchaeota archaeon]
MTKDEKITVSGAEANFLKAMLKSAEKKFMPASPNMQTEDPEEIEKIYNEMRSNWAKKNTKHL